MNHPWNHNVVVGAIILAGLAFTPSAKAASVQWVNGVRDTSMSTTEAIDVSGASARLIHESYFEAGSNIFNDWLSCYIANPNRESLRLAKGDTVKILSGGYMASESVLGKQLSLPEKLIVHAQSAAGVNFEYWCYIVQKFKTGSSPLATWATSYFRKPVAKESFARAVNLSAAIKQ